MQFLVAAQTVSFKFVNRCYFSITSYRCGGYPAHGPTADPDGVDPTKHDMAREKNIVPWGVLAYLEMRMALGIRI